MDKASKIDLDTTVKKIMDDEMGVILLEVDEKNIYDILAKETTYETRQGMYGNGYHVTYHLYPIMYGKQADISQNLIKCRANAIQNVFDRWNALGYNKRYAKFPYRSKAFNNYLDKIDFLKADYMLLMVD